MERPKWIPRWLHLPFIIFITFIVWMTVFGENNFFKGRELKSEINDLKAELQDKQDSIKFYEDKVDELNTENESLEKIAREQYGMRRINEEVFITDIP